MMGISFSSLFSVGNSADIGFRGTGPISLDKWAEIAEKLSLLLIHAPEIKKLDINPLIAIGEIIKAVDARVLIEKNKIK